MVYLAEMAWVYRLAYFSLLPELHENFPPGASPNLRILEVQAQPSTYQWSCPWSSLHFFTFPSPPLCICSIT